MRNQQAEAAAKTKRAAFTVGDIERALKGVKAAGVKASIVIRPDGTMLIAPANDTTVLDVARDQDARMDAFAGRCRSSPTSRASGTGTGKVRWRFRRKGYPTHYFKEAVGTKAFERE